MLYLINCTVSISQYMGDTKKKEMNHIVEAESERDAENKVSKYYDAQTNEFSVYYSVDINYCNEVIK